MLSLRQLRDLGVVGAEHGDERLRVETRTRLRFAITTVVLDDAPRWVVKVALGANATAWLQHEHAMLTWLSASSAASLAPVGQWKWLAAAAADGDHPSADASVAALVAPYVPGTITPDQPPGSLEGLGALVGRLHTAVVSDDAPQVPPLHASQIGSSLLPQLAARAGDHLDTARALAFVRAQWRAGVPTHGDVKWEHLRGVTAPVIVDWELGGQGDPAWDVASVMHEALLGGQAVAALPRCVRAYEAAVSRTLPDAFAVRLAAALAVRFLQSAEEFGNTSGMHHQSEQSNRWARWWAAHPRTLVGARCAA